MEIKVLIENLVYNQGLKAEHGLSFYIESDNYKILFDTGQTDSFIDNAKNMDIDLEDIDYLIISHGHYDHCGGIESFMKINSKAKILIKEKALEKKYSSSTGDIREISMNFNINSYLNRVVFVNDYYNIGDGFRIIGEFNHPQDFEAEEKQLFIKEKESYIIDKFKDELVLVFEKEDSIALISGCSHNGIVNIIKSVEEKTDKKLTFLIGGMHLKKSSKLRQEITIEYLENRSIEQLIVNHCTGVDVYSKLKERLKDRVDYGYTGKIYKV